MKKQRNLLKNINESIKKCIDSFKNIKLIKKPKMILQKALI